jgi:hemoglobin
MSERRLQPLCDKIGRQRVEQVVRDFYQALREDPELAGFFSGIDDFTEHERRICDFWWIAMGGRVEDPPRIDMVGKHFPLGITEQALDQWLALFRRTLAGHMDMDLALQWYTMANGIAERLRDIVVRHRPPGVRIER